MATATYLVFDLGASNGRAVAARFDGSRFEAEVTHRFDNRPVTAAGTLYWDLLRLYSEVCVGIQKAVKEHSAISAMGIDTWGVDFGLVDNRGKLLANPIHYRDARRNAAAEEAFGVIPRAELFRLSGAPMLSLMSVFSLYAMKRDGASELSSAHRFLMIPDLLHYLLSGEAVNEYTNATMTAAYSLTHKRWEPGILSKLGIPLSLFGTPVLPGTRIGALCQSVCRDLEVGPIPIVAPATHDSSSAVAGIPVQAPSRRWAFLSLGTWAIIGRETDVPLIDDAALEAGWGNEGTADGRSYLAAAVTGLWIIQGCREKWIKDRGAEIGWDEVMRQALAASPFKTLVDVDDPRFATVHPDVPSLVAAYCTEHGLPVPEGIGEIARCLYESLALKCRFRFDQMRRLTGERIELIHIVGGGSQNVPLCQWIADATGIAVVAGPAETTVAGNLIMQLKGTGEIDSLSQGREIVARSFPTRSHDPGSSSPWDEACARFPGTAG